VFKNSFVVHINLYKKKQIVIDIWREYRTERTLKGVSVHYVLNDYTRIQLYDLVRVVSSTFFLYEQIERTHYRICFNGTLWWNIIPGVEDLRFNTVYKEYRKILLWYKNMYQQIEFLWLFIFNNNMFYYYKL